MLVYNIFQGSRDIRIAKTEAMLKQLCGDNPLAFEEKGPKLSKHKSQHETGRRQKGWP